MKKKKRNQFDKRHALMLVLGYFVLIHLYHLRTYYYSAPLDSTSQRAVTIVLSSAQTPEHNPAIERWDMIYRVEYLLYVSVDDILGLNKSEQICLLPEVHGRLRPDARMSGEQLHNMGEVFPEQLLLRGEIRVDERLLVDTVGDIDLWYVSGPRNAVYRCFNVSNLAAGLHTISFETSMETGEQYAVWWQILIEG